MRVCAPPMRFDITSICWKVPAVGVAWTTNSQAKPALRSGVESAARTAWERFTTTVSPAEKGRDGVNVSVLSPFEKTLDPLAVPVARPKTRKLAGVIDAVS